MKNKNLHLHMFDTNFNPQVTTQIGAGQDLSPEMKVFYDKVLIKNAKPNLVHDQFGQQRNIPKNGGKTIEFRRFSPLPKAMTPLTEGVTPNGQNLNVTAITSTVQQYGGYITFADMLVLTTIDNVMVEATELLGAQAGTTSDAITREVISTGTNVLYANSKSSRFTLNSESTLRVADFKKGRRILKTKNAKQFDKYFVAIIHPDIEYDIMCDSDWVDASKYAGSTQLFEGEIGRIFGVRFVESTEAKIIEAKDLTATSRNLTVKTTLQAAGKTLEVDEAITSADATALAGRKVIIGTALCTVASATSGDAGAASITLTENVTTTNGTDGVIIYPGEAGAGGATVYSTLLIGKNAYGVTKIDGTGIETIVKQLGSGGTNDPLNQRATVGWKLNKTAELLVNEYMVRLESTATYSSAAN